MYGTSQNDPIDGGAAYRQRRFQIVDSEPTVVETVVEKQMFLTLPDGGRPDQRIFRLQLASALHRLGIWGTLPRFLKRRYMFRGNLWLTAGNTIGSLSRLIEVGDPFGAPVLKSSR